MENWMQRTELMVGADGMEKLKNASVLIVGLGGVGGIAAEMICRAGVGQLTIVDRDLVGISNINRQIIALHSTLNRPKAEVLAERLMQINPALQLQIINDWLDVDNTEQLLEANSFDFVLDAIDTLSPKVFLIKCCLDRDIRIISSMGSGGKMDPTQVCLANISDSVNCALARAVRKRLSRLNIRKDFPVVYSTELIDKKVVMLIEGEQNKRSTTGTISYMPALFGCFLASHVIRELIK